MNKKKKIYNSVTTVLLICGIVFMVMSLDGDYIFLAPAAGMLVLANVVNFVRIRQEKKGK